MPSQEENAPHREGLAKRSVDWRQVTGGVLIGVTVGVLLGIGATFFSQGKQIAVLEEQIKILNKELESRPAKGNANGQAIPPDRDKVTPETLVEIIKEQQRKHVRESFGELASQSFTAEDLKRFRKAGVPAAVAEGLKHDNRFLEVVLAIRAMNPAGRQALLNTAAQLSRPSWEQLGKIGPEGQTLAGQTAEKELAAAVVKLVEELIALPTEEIKKLYT